MQPAHCVHCCAALVCEANHCSAVTFGKHCHRDNPKTYRTSVHLPCASVCTSLQLAENLIKHFYNSVAFLD
jgi:hypothetical protein